jgi:hypothetical protein
VGLTGEGSRDSSEARALSVKKAKRDFIEEQVPMSQKRKDHEPPAAVGRFGWRYHHMGIPTTLPRPDEQYIEHLKIHVSGFESSPYGIEWMRFEPDCQVSELVRTVPHVAFEVDDLESAIEGKTLLGEVSSPSEGVRVAMIVDNGAPVELIQFVK